MVKKKDFFGCLFVWGRFGNSPSTTCTPKRFKSGKKIKLATIRWHWVVG